MAIGHSILVIAYHILEGQAGYEELCGNYSGRQHLQRRLIRRLELKVVVEPVAQAV